ncbi:3'-5' exonuclease [Fulvivirgaceae bacterium BMA10]|uniref:3'-5' exonuclease n=1 Tax=Splendidivirga corallicola TaxID=3051826 RepID=A0ABT8KRN6_9BACT|nr:3'-5' exonuclease [Fulvivirgaceae bacterium BMA10]
MKKNQLKRRPEIFMVKKYITKEEINELPSGKFEGKVVLIQKAEAIPNAVAEILKYNVVGFDTESKPAFKAGTYNHVALLQIALPEKVFLFRTNKIGLDTHLINLLSNPGIKKIGIALHDDVKDLQKLSAFEPRSFIELQEITKEGGFRNAGARGLAALLMGINISKAQQTSNWENPVLTEKQISYAATDAWVNLKLYSKLKELGYIED